MYCVYLNIYFKFNRFLFNLNIKSMCILKYYYYFNSKSISIYKGSVTRYRKLHKNNFYINKNYFFVFFKTIDKLFQKNLNIIFIDSDYKQIVPFYYSIYGIKNVKINKNYFLIKSSNLTLPNWKFFYKSFLLNFDVKLLIILDYKKFNKFLNLFLSYNIPVYSFVNFNTKPVYFDNFFYMYNNIILSKLFIYNLVFFLFYKNMNFKKLIFKHNYIIKFINIKL